jgi:2-C-methyl-D-erythritol 2,4-cyclodiphosphate synthase
MTQNFRIGLGEDSHRLIKRSAKTAPLVLGGVAFPEFNYIFDANSDGDVILHALCNAILSSVGVKTFDSFARLMYKNGVTDSVEYLRESLAIASEKFAGFKIQNLVISLECLIPKIAPKHESIVKNLAYILDLNEDQIGLTYTTGENLTDFGKGLGVRCSVQILTLF